MSLLLDALKKAADDKAKNSRGQPSEEPSLDEQASKIKPDESVHLEQAISEQLSDESPIEKSQDTAGFTQANYTDDTEELTLDIVSEGDEEPALSEGVAEGSLAQDVSGNSARTEETDASVTEDYENNKIRPDASNFTISDDALALLIDKTNRDVKQGKRNLIIGVAISSLIILLSGGVYYYTDMQAEIASIERKHQIAMQSMRLKTNREKTPDQTAIIRNLVSDAELEEKVEYAKAQMAKEKKQVVSRPQKQPATNKKTLSADLSIKRSNKSDPVGDNLDAAWLAYESGNYGEAKQLYKDALKIEGNNRDAQLGLGAIAVIEKDTPRAKVIYQSLLQQDPRDPIATAALTSLSNEKSSLQPDNDYLLSLLRQNPDAPHLNFSLGNNYAQQNKWKSAQQYYFKAWQLDNENADYIFNLAVSMDQLGKQQQAIGFYNDSLNKSSNRQVSFSREDVRKRINQLTGL